MSIPTELLTLLGLASALLVYIWREQLERNKRAEAALEDKASVAMVNDLRNDMQGMLDALGEKVDRIRDTEQVTAVALAKMNSQMDRLIAHADSERGTRARADERLEQLWIGELRALRHSLTGRGRRKGDPPETLP